MFKDKIRSIFNNGDNLKLDRGKEKIIEMFIVGDKVLSRDHRNPNDEVLSEIIYFYKTRTNRVIWKRNIDQILTR